MPNTIEQNLQRLTNAKDAISEAITEKGIILPENAGFESFASAINSIQTGSQPIIGQVSAGSSSVTLIWGWAIQIEKDIYLYAAGLSQGNYIYTVSNPLMTVSGLNLPNDKSGVKSIIGVDAAKLINSSGKCFETDAGYSYSEWQNWVKSLSLSNCGFYINKTALSVYPQSRGDYCYYPWSSSSMVYICAKFTLY